MHVSKIIVLKGKTLETKGKWEKVELTIEMTLSQNDNPEEAKAVAYTLLDAWLKKEQNQNSK